MPRPNNGIQLKRNRFGIYELRWSEKGRSKRSSTGTGDLGEAERIRASFILLEERRHTIEARGDGPLMVADCIGDPDHPGEDYWHEHVEPHVVDKESIRYDRAKLIKHFGHLAVRDITPTDVTNYVKARAVGEGAWVLDDKSKQVCAGVGRPSVPATVRGELATLNAAIAHAVRAKRLGKKEAPDIALPPKSEPRDRWLSEAEADRLLAAAAVPLNIAAKDIPTAPLPRVFLFVALALNTASRRSALLQMRWDQIDLDNRLIYLNPKGRRQTKKRRPKVPISDELLPILRRAYAERQNEFVLGLDGASIRTSFSNAVMRAQLQTRGPDKVTPHVLRHTWATWAAQAGKSMFDIAGVLGDTVETVTRTYSHHHPDYLREAVNNVRPSARGKPELRAVA